MSGILVDIHQPAKHAEILGSERRALPTDYMWTTAQGLSVGVEAKLSGTDFYNSLWPARHEVEARLAHQIPDLVQNFDIPILLVHVGDMDVTRDGRFRAYSMGRKGRLRRTWAAAWNTVLGYQLRYPELCIWPSRRAWRIPHDLLRIKAYLDESQHRSQERDLGAVRRKAQAAHRPLGEAWLAALVGPSLAGKALETMGSLEAIISGPEAAQKTVPGWGPKTTKLLKEAIHGEAPNT